jgi:DNA-binding NarL/FixJ family response regulator
MAAGLGNHEIAARLVLSEKTVRNHVAAILAKLQARDRPRPRTQTASGRVTVRAAEDRRPRSGAFDGIPFG